MHGTYDVVSTNSKPSKKTELNLVLNSQVAQALTVIGDRWAFLIIRDLYLGARKFEELRKRSGAARGTLSLRLRNLIQNGIIYKKSYQNKPLRYEYRLTDKGLDLYPLVLVTWNWETKWGDSSDLPPKLVHNTCGKSISPNYCCSHCHVELKLHDVSFTTNKNAVSVKKIPPRFQRRSKTKNENHPDVDRRFFHVIDIIGDRWIGLIIASMYFGVRRFDDIVSAIDIATNILSNRLKVLLKVGVIVRKSYQNTPVRYEYRLSEKGQELYPTAITIHEWANKWLLDSSEQFLKLQHILCNTSLVPELLCSECEEPLRPRDITFNHEIKQYHTS